MQGHIHLSTSFSESVTQMKLQHGIEAGLTCQKKSEAGSFVVITHVLFLPKLVIRARIEHHTYSMSILVRYKATISSELTHVNNRHSYII